MNSLVQRLEVTEVGSSARVALVNVLARFEDPRTTPILQRVLRGDDVNSRDAAALGLARRWDPVAVTQLIRMAQAKRHGRAAVQHLEILTSQAIESEEYDGDRSQLLGLVQDPLDRSPCEVVPSGARSARLRDRRCWTRFVEESQKSSTAKVSTSTPCLCSCACCGIPTGT